VVDDEGKMVACILGGDFTKDNGYNRWLRFHMHSPRTAFTTVLISS
jgi:hypothetical protein